MIKYHSAVLFVKDIENAKQFYCDFLFLKIEMDMGKNVILENGLTLWEIQEDNIIVKKHGKENLKIGNKFELCFETDNLDEVMLFIEKNKIAKVHEIHEEPWGQKTIRIYDYDMNIVEIGEELKVFLDRMVKSGMQVTEICKKTGMKKEDIEKTIGYQI